MKLTLSLIFAVFFTFLWVDTLSSTGYNKELPPNCHELDTALVVPKPILKNNEVFFLGEFHYTPENPCLKIGFIKYLYKNANVRNVVQEIGPATAFFINQYLKTGDEELLTKITSPFAFEKEYLLDLYKFNKSLDPKQKLHIIGIDLDYFCNNIKALISIFEQAKIRDDFKWILDKLEEIPYEDKVCISSGHTYSLKDWEVFREEIKLHLEQFPKLYQEKLGDNIYYLERILATHSYMAPSAESFKYDNFIKAHQIFGRYGKYFVNYGTYHAGIKKQVLAAQLLHKKQSPFYNKVLSIGVAYSKIDARYSNLNSSKAIFMHMETMAKQYFTLYNMEQLYKKYPSPKKNYHYTLFIKND